MQRVTATRGLRFLPKLTLIIAAALVIGVPAVRADVYTAPVGFISVAITNNTGYSSMALPFQTMRNDAGLVYGVSTLTTTEDVVTVLCSTCGTTNWALPQALQYVEFASGAGLGYRFSVGANTATTITLEHGNNIGPAALGVASNDTYVIHPYWRIADVFGPAVGGVLSNGSASTKADAVEVWNGTGFGNYWPKNNGNWQGGTYGGNDPLMADESVLVYRRYGPSTNLIVMGEVRTTNLVSVLGVGYNLVGNSFPSSVLVSNMNLIGSGSGFQGGSASTKSDLILVWNGVGFDSLWYKTSNSSWQGAGLVGAYPMLPSSTYFIWLATGHSGYWPRPLPYTP